MKAPFKFLGVIKDMPVNVVLNGKTILTQTWDKEFFIERPEDEYALGSPEFRDKKVRIIRKRDWDNTLLTLLK